jgi:peptidoglycan/xylan/chitin deacetylase (PgdA/CDA1 family)
MSAKEEKTYIQRQLQSLKTTTGSYPVGWFVGRCSPHSKALVHEVHEEFNAPLLYSSDAFNDDIPYWIDVPAEKGKEDPKGMLMMPYSYDCNDLKYQIAPGSWGSHTAFSDYLKATFDTLYAEALEGRPKMMSIGLHCRISGKPGRSSAIDNFLKHALEKEGVWFTTRKDIALHWREKFPYQAQNPMPGNKKANGVHLSNGNGYH